MRVGFTWKRGRDAVTTFVSSAVISLLFTVPAFIALIRMVRATPALHMWGSLAIVVGIGFVLLPVRRLRAAWKGAAPRAIDDPVLRETVNMMMLMFFWGNVLFTVLALLVYAVWNSR